MCVCVFVCIITIIIYAEHRREKLKREAIVCGIFCGANCFRLTRPPGTNIPAAAAMDRRGVEESFIMRIKTHA